MSREDLDRLRSAWEAAPEEPQAFLALFDEKVEWDMTTGPFPEREKVYGPDAVREFFEKWSGAFDDWGYEPEEMIDAGANAVVHMRQWGRGKESGVPVDNHVFQVWTFEDGKVIRFRAFASRAEALRAVGEDVGVVVDQFAATNARDFPRAMSLYADDVELFVHPGAFLTHGRFSGKEAVGQWFADWFATFAPGYHFDIDEARDVGGVVLIVASHSGHGRTSGVEVQGQTAYLYRVRDGKITGVGLYPSRDEALAAADA